LQQEKKVKNISWQIKNLRTIHQTATCLFMAFLPVSLVSAQTVIPADAKATCTVPPSTFKTWFKTGSPSLNGEVLPANSVTFPNIPNCSFYQWSEQMYLWLTSPTPASYGGGKGLIFDSAAFFDVTAPDANGNRQYVRHQSGTPTLINVRASQVGPNGLQTIIDKTGKMFEVLPAPTAANGKSLIRNKAGKFVEVDHITVGSDNKAVFFDAKKNKITPSATMLDATLAARVAPHLLGMNLAVKSATTQNLVQGFKSGVCPDGGCEGGGPIFVNSQGVTIVPTQGQAGDAAVLMSKAKSLVYYATMVNDVFAYLQTGTKNNAFNPAMTQFPTTQSQLNQIIAYAQTKGVTFPDPNALAIEVKTSWIDATGLDTSKYITTVATVPTYNQTTALWTPLGTKTMTLAMVGIHVVGSAASHPEMIWATFEHINNAPNGAYSYTKADGTTGNVAQSASGTWLFSATNSASATYNVPHMTFVSPNIVAASGQTISPSDTLRVLSWGMPGTATSSNTEVISINNSIMGQLVAGDVRGNYMMTGATWTKNGASTSPTSNQVGTSQLANTTMETYQQATTAAGPGSNCFSCHTSNLFSVSHIFNSLVPLQ
jgi:hypothetical protein